ncbi:flippase-like domain-containing protein [candidate division WWE3 bacterium]|nr:flippase-like domain-containing protein [candidate division WWE3 bacterium]
MKKNIKIIFKILVSLLLISIILLKVDNSLVIKNLSLVDVSFIPAIILMFLLNYFLSSLRWKKLILSSSTTSISTVYLTKLYIIGSFFNNFMPTSIGGDVYKVYRLGKKIKNTTEAFIATFMERFTGMIALVLISYLGLIKTLGFWIAQLPPFLSVNSTFLLFFKFLLFGGFWIFAVAGFLSLKIFSKKFNVLHDIYDSLLRYKNKKRILIDAVLTSFLVQLVAILSHWLVLKSLGVTVEYSYALFVFPIIFLAGFFIPSINGFGVQDALYIRFFTEVGVPMELALSASITYHFFKLAVSLLGGLFYAFDKSD